MPTLLEIRQNLPLSNLSMEFGNKMEDFIADKILPKLPHGNPKGRAAEFPIFGKEDQTIKGDVERRPRTSAAEIDYSITWEPYATKEYALCKGMDVQEMDESTDPLQPAMDATRKLTKSLLLQREKRVIDMITAYGTTFASYKQALAAYNSSTNKTYVNLDDYTNSDPNKIFAALKQVVKQNCGQMPNTIILSPDMERVIANHPKVLDLRKYSAAVPSPDLLPDGWLGFKNILRASATYNATASSTTGAYLMGNYAVLAYIDPNPGKTTLSLGYTFIKHDFSVREWFNEEKKTQYVEASHDIAEKICAAQCGLVVYDCLSA